MTRATEDVTTEVTIEGEVVAESGEPLSTIPEPLRHLAVASDKSIAKREVVAAAETTEETKELIETVKKVISNKKVIRAGLIKIDARQLKTDRDCAMSALRWLCDLRETGMGKEVLFAAREILEEARERDRMHMEANAVTQESKQTNQRTLTDGAHTKLLRAVIENE